MEIYGFYILSMEHEKSRNDSVPRFSACPSLLPFLSEPYRGSVRSRAGRGSRHDWLDRVGYILIVRYFLRSMGFRVFRIMMRHPQTVAMLFQQSRVALDTIRLVGCLFDGADELQIAAGKVFRQGKGRGLPYPARARSITIEMAGMLAGVRCSGLVFRSCLKQFFLMT